MSQGRTVLMASKRMMEATRVTEHHRRSHRLVNRFTLHEKQSHNARERSTGQKELLRNIRV